MERIGQIQINLANKATGSMELETSQKSAVSLDMPTFLQGLTILKTHFPKLDLPKERVAIMHETLADLNREQLIKGVKAFCLAHEEIYPGTNIVAKIRKYALGHRQQTTAIEAWQEVWKRACARVTAGAWKPSMANFDDQNVQNIVEALGGLLEIGRAENVSVVRGQFTKAYESLRNRDNFEDLIGE